MTSPEFDALSQRYGAAYKWWATAAVMTGCIATVLSSTIVNVAMPDIMGEFGMGQDQVQWLSTAFLASMTASMLATDWTLHTFGVRRAYMGAMAAFVAASVMGCMSPGVELLILARSIQGAAAGLVSKSLVLAMGRHAAFSVLGSTAPLGQLRGQPHRVVLPARRGDALDVLADVPVVVTYAPAYLLRNPAAKRQAWQDLCLASSLVGNKR